mgnify:CR=1 FL=1
MENLREVDMTIQKESNHVFFKHDNGVYLKVDDGYIVLADKHGNIIGGQTDVCVDNGVGYPTTSTVTFEVSGWVKD